MSLENRINSAAGNGAWVKPTHFKLDGTDDSRFEKLLDSEPIAIYDPIHEIAEDMFELENPDRKGDTAALSDYAEEFAQKGLEYGEWVHMPWLRTVVRYPEKSDHLRLRTFRNQYLITEQEQDTLYDKKIAAFGMSVGSNIVDQLVQSGYGNAYLLGDFDHLAPSNLNRIRASMGQVGLSKVDIMARKISEIDPYIEQVHIREGFDPDTTPDKLDAFGADLIVEEIDNVSLKSRIRQYAKKHGIPLTMTADLAEMSQLHVERHDREDVKPFNGRLSEAEFEALAEGNLSDAEKLKVNIKILGMKNALASARFIESNLDIGKRLAGIPQLGAIATGGAALTDRGIREILLSRELKSGVYLQSTGKTLKAQRLATRREHFGSISKLLKSTKAKSK